MAKEAYMPQEVYLQQLPGADKRNPVFTISRNTEAKCLHVYYGGDLFEKVPDDRDDHVLFRNLTHANGIMISSHNKVEVHPFPTAHYTPALRKIVTSILRELNEENLHIPDGSGRTIQFLLGNKAGIELANTIPLLSLNT